MPVNRCVYREAQMTDECFCVLRLERTRGTEKLRVTERIILCRLKMIY